MDIKGPCSAPAKRSIGREALRQQLSGSAAKWAQNLSALIRVEGRCTPSQHSSSEVVYWYSARSRNELFERAVEQLETTSV